MSMVLVGSGSLFGSVLNITSIPQDAEDLILFLQVRTTANTTNSTLYVQINGRTNAEYDVLRIRGNPAAGLSGVVATNDSQPNSAEIPGTSVGSNNYSNIRYDFKDYTTLGEKVWLGQQVMSTISDNNPINLSVSRSSNTAAITSIQIKEQQSTFTGVWSLYKIVAN